MTTRVSLPGLRSPGAGFDQPFEMLAACHDRVQRTLALLARLRDHVRAQGGDASARQAAQDVLRYFDVAAPLHHEDEERHVFPLLLAAHANDATLTALVRQLQADHVQMALDWAGARVPLAALVAGAQDRFSAPDEALLAQFAARYATHLAREDSEAYPAAQALLADAALQAMGREMAARRGVAMDVLYK